MEAFTPAERRGALLVALLLALGAAHDLWLASRPLPAPGPGTPGAPAAETGPAPDTTGGPPGTGTGAPAPTLDLNRASARELDALPGVGPVLAARIVAYREHQGPFRRREELMAVRGIGPRLFARLAARVAVEGDERPAVPPSAAPPRP